MSSLQKTALAQLDTQAFALMGRLHVILRRESGRVTDIEYMRINSTYCKYVLALAEQLPHDVMPEICARLREIYFGPQGLFVIQESPPSLSPGTEPVPDTPDSVTSAATGTEETPAPTTEQVYVGRLR